MRILYLSKNLEQYKAANYQLEFLKALSKKNLYLFMVLVIHILIKTKISQILLIYMDHLILFLLDMHGLMMEKIKKLILGLIRVIKIKDK